MSTESASTTIRPATPADLPAIGELLALRDETPWDAASVAWFTMDLDPDRCLCWIAFAGTRPIGLSMMYVRTLLAPGGPERVGYWANLYIVPEFRDRLLYPRLPMAMFQALPAHRLAYLYTSVRLPDLATAHTRIGFAKLGAMPVLAKPLRPFALLGKYKRIDPLRRIAPPFDGLYGSWLAATRPSLPRGATLESVEPKAHPDSPLIAELVARIAEISGDRRAQQWTTASLRHRYEHASRRGGGYGGRYEILVARDGGRFAGGVIYRLAERGEGIYAGVVMDVVEGPAVDALLAEVERRAHAAGAEVMLFLSGLGEGVATRFGRAGYRRTHEAYELMVWPKQALERHAGLGDLARWSYTLRDHDAF